MKSSWTMVLLALAASAGDTVRVQITGEDEVGKQAQEEWTQSKERVVQQPVEASTANNQPVSWHLSASWISCNQFCSERGEFCTEAFWPDSTNKLKDIVDLVKAPCQDTQPGHANGANPTSTRYGICFWKGRDKPRCGEKHPGRICPCQTQVQELQSRLDESERERSDLRRKLEAVQHDEIGRAHV